MVELSVLGISLQEDSGVAPVLLLHPLGSRRILCVSIGPMEALAITTALHGVEARAAPSADGAAKDIHPQEVRVVPIINGTTRKADAARAGDGPLPEKAGGPAGTRDANSGATAAGSPQPQPQPQTHELLVSVIRTLGGVLVAVNLLSVRDGSFIAEAVILQAGSGAQAPRKLRIDCRPSDGVVLALRCGAAIRATQAVLARADDIKTVMAGLPEHVRTIAAARLAALKREGGGRKVTDLSSAIEAVRAARAELALSREPGRELISVARKMLEEEREAGNRHEAEELARLFASLDAGSSPLARADAPAPAGNNEEKESATPEKGGREARAVPQIRVSVVRQPAPVREMGQFPTVALTNRLLAGLGLTPSELAVMRGASDEERWDTLLRLLSPETKVLM